MSSSELSVQGEEPPMFLQRPSTARSQDISHVLARTFRHLFTRDAVAPETVQYLGTSKGGDNPYHEKYVERLEKVQEEHQQRLAEAAMLERHIMQAQARAMSADERAIQRMHASNRGFPDLGLPPARAHLRSCLDTELMRDHNLLIPEDYSLNEAPLVPPPSAPAVPLHARETVSSQRHHRDHRDQSPLYAEEDTFQFQSEAGDSFSSSYDDESSHQLELQFDREQSNMWQSNLTAELREVNRQGLKNLEERVDHLRNPRFVPPSASKSKLLTKSNKKKAKEVCIKPEPEPVRQDPIQVFLPSTPEVVFKTYKVGEVYEMNLELKNISGAMRPVRVIPPATKYFSVSLGQFPGEHGLVAPGMSCVYKVRFIPDSLGDFDDEIIVQSQSSEPLSVLLLGRRPPPVLSLPEVINVGHCLVGGIKSAQLTVKNTGGKGRFCLMPLSSWPAANFKTVASVNTVVLPPFEICPPRFELLEGQSFMLEILFHPTSVETYKERFVMVCDNCQVKYFDIIGEGQMAQVELASVEDGVDEPLVGEAMDVSATHLIRFNTLNPYTYIQRKLTVRNATDVALPFNWLLVKPFISNDNQSPSLPTERVQEVDCVFTIEPETGILSPGSTTPFNITFAPPDVNEFHSILHLVLRNIPTPSSIQRDGTRDSESGEKRRTVSPILQPASAAAQEPLVTDLTGLEIALKGDCEPLQVLVQPYAIHIPGQILVETAVKQQFRLLNHSMTSIIFQWENVSTGQQVIQVEPPIGELGAMCEMDIDVYVSGSEPGLIDHTLLCYVQHLADPLTLHIKAQIKGPEVTIECADVNFGLVRFGESKSLSLPITNSCRVASEWSIRESSVHSVEGPSEFTFEPAGGVLRPLESAQVVVTWSPQKLKSLSSLFELEVVNGSRSSVFALGECQKPSVCLMSCEMTATEVYKDVASVLPVDLLNQTLLDTVFSWAEPEGADASNVTVKMEPASGHLEGRKCFPVILHFIPHKTGPISDLRIPCKVAEMDDLLVLSLKADVKGLSVEFRTRGFTASESRDDDLVLDFGPDNLLGSAPKCELYIKNLSAIVAPYTLSVEHFFSKPPSPPSSAKPGNTVSTMAIRRQGMLGRTPNLSDPLSKTPEKHESDLKRTMLMEGKGAAFMAEPAAGILQAFGQQRIQLTAFSDVWGDYNDRLICKTGDTEIEYIPMKMGVIGCPLYFQMVAAQPNTIPIVRFGTHVNGAPSVTRSMRINNPSPVDIRVDWESFVQDPEDKEQLLDVMISYGKIFPLKDSDGNEIVPEEEEPEPITCNPTEFIWNSPDSSPPFTRETTQSSEQFAPLAASRPKVISLNVRIHEGKSGAEQYSVSPTQMVVPAKGYNTAHVTFHPTANNCSSERDEHFEGFALGYLSLDGNVNDDKCIRKQHYDVEPMRMKMTAAVKPALLNVEFFDEDGMRYITAVSDLMREGQLMPECIKLCRATLSNPTEMPLTFKLITDGPFYIVEMDPVTHQPVDHMQATEDISLLPRQSAVVQVGFRIHLGLLDLLPSARPWDGKEEQPIPEDGTDIRLQLGEQSQRKLHLLNYMQMQFTNKKIQKVALHGTLNIPDLCLSKDEVDFGTCLVGQRREIHLILSNPTASDSYWTVTKESQSDTVTNDTFKVTPSSGLLGAHLTHIAQNKSLLQLFFTAKHAEDYEMVYSLRGMFGEKIRRLTIRGKGSYDGKHEALVNV